MSDLRDRLDQAVAAADAGDGGWTDGSRVEPERGADVSGATVAATRRWIKDLAMVAGGDFQQKRYARQQVRIAA